MADQDRNQKEHEEPRMLTLQEKWKMDENMQAEGISNYQVFTPQCESCRFAEEKTIESCQKYVEIPWEIMTVQKPCPYYRRREDLKPKIQYFVADDRREILKYDFWPVEALWRARKFPLLAVWAYDGTTPLCGAVFTRESDEEEVLVVLQCIYTLKNYRGLGIASGVMKYAGKLFADSGTGRLAAFLDQEETELPHFFQAIGWEECDGETQSLEYTPKAMISERVKAFVSGNTETDSKREEVIWEK